MKKCYIIYSFLLLLIFTNLNGWGQVSITSNGTAFTQNFDGMGTSGTATLPTGIKIGTDWSTGTTATTLAFGSTGTGVVTGSSSGGAINWANGVTASATDRALGFLNSGSYSSPRSIVYAFTNNTGSTVSSIAVSFDYEKYRSGSRQFDWTFFHGSTSTPSTSATGGDQSYPADGNNTTISNPPTTTSKSFTISGLSIANGSTYYLKWTFTGLGGSTNGQGIGIDNFSITTTAAVTSYTMTYNGNGSTGGSVPLDGSSPYTSGSTVTVLGNTGSLVKTGYTFAGWNTAADGSGTNYTSGNTFSMPSANTTLYAKWTINSYSVTYDGNTNTAGTAPIDAGSPYNYNSTVTVKANTGSLVKTGYTFSGWNTAADGSGTGYAATGSATFTLGAANVILYAQYAINTYTVTYNGNTNTGGTAPVDGSSPYNYNANVTVLTAGALTKTGYTFSGWNTAADGSGTNYSAGGTISAISSNVILYAKWAINSYTISYNGNSNDGGTAPVDGSSPYNYNTIVTVLGVGTLTRTGYIFAGWNTAANGSGTSYVQANTFSMPAANVTLYAKWTSIATYTVTYNGNSNTGGTAPVDGSSPYSIGATVTVLGNTGSLTRTGYTFAGWNTAANGSGTGYVTSNTFSMPASNTILYAQWTPGVPTVTTPTVTSITNTAAVLGATVTGDGGISLTARGTVYKTSSPVASTDNALAEGGTAVSTFTHTRTTLTPETKYYFAGYATNSIGQTGLSAEGNFYTLSNPPTAQAANISALAASSSVINIGWDAATFPSSGATVKGYVLIQSTSGTPTFTATNGQVPAAGVGTIISSTISDALASYSSTGLAGSTTYYYLLVPFCWDGVNAATYNYLTSGALTTNATTTVATCTTPATQASSVSFSSVSASGMTISWTAGSGDKSLVLVRASGIISITPSNGNTYTTNATFGSGQNLGSFIYACYDGAATSFALTNLSASTTYYVTVFTYNSSGHCYNTTTTASSSQTTSAASSVIETFEVGSRTPNTKTGYTTADVYGYVYYWTFNNALIGTSASDRYNGARSARIQSTGSITMLEDKSNGLGTVTVKHALFGSDASTTWRMEVSDDGGATWLAYVSSTITTSSTTLSTATFNVNLSGNNMRIRIVKLSGGTSSRLSIDDISLGDYVSSNTITTGAISGSPFCISNSSGSSITVPFTSTGTFNSDNIYTAQLSDASGSFTTPTDIGNLTSTANSGNISATIPAGTANGSGYKVRIVSFSPLLTGTTSASTLIVTLNTPDISGLNAVSASGTSLTIGWTDPSNCFDEVMLVAKALTSITDVPSGDGTAYTANTVFGSGTNLGSNDYVIYKGSGASATVTSLTTNTLYYFKVFVRKGTSWSDGISISATPTTDIAGDWRTNGAACTWSSTTNWQQYNGSAWVAATSAPNSASGGTATVTINNGHIVTLSASAAGNPIGKLVVNAGGKLYANNGSASTSNRYLTVYGDIICNGDIGNGAGVYDVICFNIDGTNQTISGTGNFNACRMRKNYTVNSTTNLTIAMNVNLMFAATASFSGTEIYNNCGGNGIFNVSVNENSTLNLQLAPASTGNTATAGNLSIDGVNGDNAGSLGTSTKYEQGGTFTINGTLNVPGTIYAYTDNVTNPIQYVIGTSGIVNCVNLATANTACAGTPALYTGSSAAGTTIQILNGGKLNLNGGTGSTYTSNYTALTSSDANYNQSFCVSNNTSNTTFTAGLGTTNITYDFQAGSTVEYSGGSGTMVIQTGLTYSNLLISGGATKTFSSTLNVNKNCTITSPAVLSGGSNNINVGGDWNDYSTSGLTEGTGTVLMNGTGPQNIYCPSGENFYKLSFSNAGTKTLHDLIYTASDLTINSGSGAFIPSGNNVYVAGNWTNNQGTSGFTEGTDKVTMNGSTAQTITTTGGENFYDLSIKNTATYPTGVTLGNNVNIASGGTLYIESGSLDAGTNTLDGSGGLTMNTLTYLTLAKNSVTLPELSGTYNLFGGVVIFNGTGSQTVRAINYYDLTSTSTGTRTLPGTGTVGIAGTFTPDFPAQSYTITGSTVDFNGIDQNIPLFNFYNVGYKNGGTKTLTGSNTVYKALTLGNSLAVSDGTILALGNYDISLHSDNSLTANVSQTAIPSTNVTYGTGRFIVERYLPMQTLYSGRRWRLVGVPVSTTNAPTINAAWQEGLSNSDRTNPVDTYHPYGTTITKSTTYNASDGYDQGSTNSPSIYSMTTGTGAWNILPSTKTAITNYDAYMLFVRGNRSIQVSNQYINTTDSAILRIKGQINIGDVIKSAVTGKQLISNPYPSAISLNNVTCNGVPFNSVATNTFYMWDPKLLGSKNVGNWVTFISDGNGNTFTSAPTPIDTPSMSVFGSNGNIESGGAFYMNTTSSLIFHESDKLTTSSTNGLASRPMGTQNYPTMNIAEFYTNLAYLDATGNSILADGVATTYSDMYNNEVDNQDAPKFQSFQTKEKIGLLRNDSLLVIERRKTITVSDTIFLQMLKLDFNYKYQLQFIGRNFAPELSAYLIDKYLDTAYEISTMGVSRHDFVTTGDAGSLATNRFNIIFKLRENGPLPVKFTDVKASQLSEGSNAVEWKTSEELSTKEYRVEKSTDGIHFVQLGTVNATGKGAYNWTDNNAKDGINYYRIISIGNNGAMLYSSIVSVKTGTTKQSSISVYSNPVKNGVIDIQFINKAAGNYGFELINALGQIILTKEINYQGGTSIVNIGTLSVEGIYELRITMPDKRYSTLKVLIK